MAKIPELRQRYVAGARRVVVKVGSNVLGSPGKRLDDERVAALSEQISRLADEGRQVALVSSGAIASGMDALGIETRPATMPQLQAAASVGQARLAARYDECFRRYGRHAGQVLLTREDVDSRERFTNARNTLNSLFELGCVPVINENDTTSTEEIEFGENDMLAALVAGLIDADLLILLTSVPGLLDGEGRLVELVEKVDETVAALAHDGRSAGGSGGMVTKLEAARIATEAGEAAVIADGLEPDVLVRLVAGEALGTLFVPSAGRLASRKRWIRFASRPRGTLRVDEGARRAVGERGKSLLPSGIVSVEGDFAARDVVGIAGPDGAEFARGRSNYSSADVARIVGMKSSEVKATLGEDACDEVVHRDDLALTD